MSLFMTPKQKFIYRKMETDVWHTSVTISRLLRKPKWDLTNTLASMVSKGFLKTQTSRQVEFFLKEVK